ncbi:hypothetical protein AMAG_05166 [Allomyces macrogynus ATCC 38327]|uniref:Uncharacterized protein n=1 Tax=Allomyces macrogynus (strain ATCC 38327) TaxID=578462 RepID=A0A0L0SAU9_ALLM3|nr:hypothetical protein AMAG_05166 [Allomyces macrogynus ATCC 38327]|eukprot:KNE59703.1 hypothetical protein AMAG_05166 [Allomyces macrogynus ATCC 38327]
MSIGGNHDLNKWASSNGYSKVLADCDKRLGMDKYCMGEVGIKSACNFRGVTIVTSGNGKRGSGHDSYLESSLSSAPKTAWKFFSWHKNQAKLQTGDKNDESPYVNQQVVSTSSNLAVTPGKSWLTVTGTAFGALFCRFNEDGKSPYKASCQFKLYDGQVLDSFTTTFTPGAPVAVAKYESAASKCRPIHVEAAANKVPTT